MAHTEKVSLKLQQQTGHTDTYDHAQATGKHVATAEEAREASAFETKWPEGKPRGGPGYMSCTRHTQKAVAAAGEVASPAHGRKLDAGILALSAVEGVGNGEKGARTFSEETRSDQMGLLESANGTSF